MTRVNEYVADETEGDSFVTLTLIRFDPRTRTITYANAGNHPPGLVLDPAGNVRAELTSNALPLGIMNYVDFPVPDPIVLNPGELLVLVTDGILEAESPEGELFGDERLLEVVRAVRSQPARRDSPGARPSRCPPLRDRDFPRRPDRDRHEARALCPRRCADARTRPMAFWTY